MKIINERLQSLIDEGDGRSTTYLDYNQVYQKVKDEGYELTQNDLNHLTLILKENEWTYTSLSPSKMRISDTKDEPFNQRC